MPYYPDDKPIEAYCYEFLFDEKNGDFDTVAIKHINKPSLIEPLVINRYFKEVDGEWKEIYYSEYMSRLENRIH
jgi:hypothetical protein